jgi:molybdenum cofactor cytidylyltransferase
MLPDNESSADSPKESLPELNFVILLLAAGASSRMGQSKQLLELAGEPLLARSVKTALGTGASEVVVILGANEQAHEALLKELPVKIVTNHYWKGGMGSSIKTGFHYIIKEVPEARAVIIMVCDQPEVHPDYLRQLVTRHIQSGKSIVASAYSDTHGVPVLFARSFFSNILMLQDEHGAKKIIEQFPEHVSSIAFPEGSIDLDTPQDYELYLQKKKVTD